MKSILTLLVCLQLISLSHAKANKLSSCGFSTSYNIKSDPLWGQDLSWHSPDGLCDAIGLIPDDFKSAIECRSEVDSSGYSCFQITKGEQNDPFWGRDKHFRICYGCLK